MSGDYDIRIDNAIIVDGTGGPRFRGGVGIVGERIAAVGDVTGDAARRIDAAGLVISPGFIDSHSHADRELLAHPLAENFVMQGVTTFVGGNCGYSLAPKSPVQDTATWKRLMRLQIDIDPDWETFAEWLSTVETCGLAVNYAPLLGHGAVRAAVLGESFKRKATSDEVERMKVYVREAMQSGAFGMSAGMDYHSEYADAEGEIVPLLRIVQEAGGLFSPHTRNLDSNWPVDDPEDYGYGKSHGPKEDAWIGRYHGFLEAVEIAKRANNIPLHIAHFGQAYTILQPHPDFLEEAAARATLMEFVDKPREQGLDVTFNVIAHPGTVGHEVRIIDSFIYPENAGPYQSVSLPEWLAELDAGSFVGKLATRGFRDQLKRWIFSGLFKFEMTLPRTDAYWMDCWRVLRCRNKEYEGENIGELARRRSPHYTRSAVFDESVETVFDILTEDVDATWAFVSDKRSNPIVLATFLHHPAGMPSIDSGMLPASVLPDVRINPSPIFYGLFPYYIRALVTEMGALSLEEAVRKATSVPAQQVLGLKDRGIISPGSYADLVLFGPDKIRMSGDFWEPSRPPEGIEYVLVNGQIAYERQKHTGVKSGKVLRRG